MTDVNDKSPESYAKRFQQIIQSGNRSEREYTKLFAVIPKEKQEQILNLVLEQQDWIRGLSNSGTEFLIRMLKRSLEAFEYVKYFPKPELVAKVFLLQWEYNQNRFAAISQDIDRQPPHVQKAMLELLAQAAEDETRTPQRREAYREALEMREAMQKKHAKASQSAENWIEYFLELIKSERDYYASKKLPKIPEGEHSEVLKQLVALDEKYRDKDAVTADGLTGPWKSSFGDAYELALAGELDDEAKQLFLEKEIATTAFLSPYSGYEQKTPKLIREAYEAGSSIKTHLLSVVRRAAHINAGYAEAAAYKWAADILQPELNTGEAWSDAFLARLDALSAEQRQHWPALVAHARTATTGKPSAKWLKEGQKHLDAVGADTFRHVLSESLPLLSRPRTFPLREDSHYTGNPNQLIDEFNAQSLKGLLWLAPLAGADATLARAVAGVVDSALKKVAGVGPRAPKVANAAVYALSQMESDAALSALARLSSTVTFKGTLKEVQKGLNAVAERLNTSPEDLLELGVPTLGLGSVGERLETWGDVEVRFTVDAAGAKLSFSKGGKPLKSVPASVKKDYADDLKELKAAQKEAEKAVSALSARLDSLMIAGKTWRGDVWQERYLHHPLAGTVARRLIWLVDGVPALWHEGEMRTTADHALNLNPDSEVRLWHPLGQPVDDVLAWRDRLDELNIRQPFKQAWREVYLLTDAERRTGTYSNRFAGHILKQHQFNQLAALRGWRNKLRLMVDDTYPPATRDLPEYGLRAEYWIEGVGDSYGNDTTESGSYLRVRTDQLRFYPIDAPENYAHAGGGGYEMWVSQEQTRVNPLPLEQIPPLVLSEIMRDVDLFVGVASVGNDPTWQDGGPEGRFRDYWHSYSFGELTETAKTRAEYLARLIPRLKIKDRLTLEGRFLKVRGDLRTYKIHLGSSNILMEPNDQYLCIIPDSKGGSGPDVDFDGDRVLSLILSKAFLLADDTKITDPVILGQLR